MQAKRDTQKAMRHLLLILLLVVATIIGLLVLAYPVLERGYQMNMDPIRQKHAQQIADVILEYASKTGQLPFEDLASEQAFMVILGHSTAHEDHFGRDPVLKRNAQWTNSNHLEELLSEGLGREIRLPRDPQKVPTFAPNVYIYFVSGRQMTVVTHLKYPNDRTVKYKWKENDFYSYTLCYEPDENREFSAVD